MTLAPTLFVSEMTKHWETNLGNVASPALQAVWHQMAATFNTQIENHGKPEGQTWRVLQPATGTGKSQGLALYAALLAGEQVNAPTSSIPVLEGSVGVSQTEPVGMLVVTRLISQADGLVETINQLAGMTVAVAKHSESKTTVEQIMSYPVLVITHAAYETSLDRINQGSDDQWSNFNWWDHGPRKLTVIDESLDIVQHNQVDVDSVSLALGMIPFSVRLQYPDQIAAIETMKDVLSKIAAVSEGRAEAGYSEKDLVLWRGQIAMPHQYDLTSLRRTLRSHKLASGFLKRANAADHLRAGNILDDTLASVQALYQNWNYYSKKGAVHTLNTASLIVPDDISGAVVLDATASSNLLWALFNDKAVVVPVPSNARSYANVTLRVARANGVGKGKMASQAKERAALLVDSLKANLPEDRRVLVVAHKAVEPFIVGHEAPFAAWDVAHFGAIDGRNDWQTHDAVVIYGLPYRDRIWSTNTFMALQGLQSNAWLAEVTERRFQDFADIRQSLEEGQIVVQIVQALNRVRSRRVIDAAGNCAMVDAFIVLPWDKTGDAILAGIQAEMPGIKIAEWDFSFGAKPVTNGRPARAAEALVAFMANRLPGEATAAELKRDLGLSDRQWERLVAELKNPASALSTRLATIEVTYRVVGKGRGSRSFLHKADD